jgi:8-hydroxy-5-deazaflavin:NADPH oxidoreductase
MRIGVFGSGTVGQTVGKKLAELGHDVMIGTRDAGKLAEWLGQVAGQASAGSVAETAAHGEILINATAGTGSLAALELAGADNLGAKILIDISNPLDFSQGFPPSMTVTNTDSLGEQIQRAYPNLRVVKTLNTLTADLMVNPRQLADGDHDVFVSGNDAAAKAEVSKLLREFGWRRIIDLGDISTARGTEMILPLWVRLYGALGTPMFNFKVVR